MWQLGEAVILGRRVLRDRLTSAPNLEQGAMWQVYTEPCIRIKRCVTDLQLRNRQRRSCITGACGGIQARALLYNSSLRHS